MAQTSIFDCGTPGTLDLPRRQLVKYDDDDLFAFESDASPNNDEIDNGAKNLKIVVTIDNTATTNNKRKRYDDSEENEDNDDDEVVYHESKKKRISNVASCSSSKSNNVNNNTLTKHVAHANEKWAQPKPETDTEPYELMKEIGCGTYGRVFKAQCRATKIVIAVKQLKCKLNTPNTVNAKKNLRRTVFTVDQSQKQ